MTATYPQRDILQRILEFYTAYREVYGWPPRALVLGIEEWGLLSAETRYWDDTPLIQRQILGMSLIRDSETYQRLEVQGGDPFISGAFPGDKE